MNDQYDDDAMMTKVIAEAGQTMIRGAYLASLYIDRNKSHLDGKIGPEGPDDEQQDALRTLSGAAIALMMIVDPDGIAKDIDSDEKFRRVVGHGLALAAHLAEGWNLMHAIISTGDDALRERAREIIDGRLRATIAGERTPDGTDQILGTLASALSERLVKDILDGGGDE